ncbi:MAG: endonuclease, partial [Ilumatobacteraceae bacterium]|nr:endonuclease [Ilumatobacteraceae bacterium]
MALAPSDLRAQAVFASLDAAFDALDALELEPTDTAAALELARRVERVGRRARAAQIEVVEVIEERGLHRPDGHAAGRVMVGHVARLSEPEAK